MNKLKKIIIESIEKNGPLPINKYMETCLYHPEFGYYMKKNPIGKQGDFITSPEISQVFGELVGIWLVNAWKTLGEPESFNLLELGPGKGTLIKDIWRSTMVFPEFQNAVKLLLFEKSNILRKIQTHNLRKVPVEWVNDLESITKKPIICFSNEFFDALPVRQFTMKNQTVLEKKVSLNKNKEIQFEFFEVNRDSKIITEKNNLIEGTIIERSDLQFEILKCLCEKLKNNGGCLLIIDYGSELGQVDTLQGMHKNKYCDFLAKPGEVDLTSHVNFGLISGYAKSFKVKPSKLITQKVFLTKMGVFERFKKLTDSLNENEKNYQTKTLNRLVSEDQMGNLIKVLAIQSNNEPDIYPFSF